MDNNLLPISAVVVGRNEAKILKRCLKGISFCEDVTYVDLDSSDGSLEIAQAAGANVQSHAVVPIGEFILSEKSSTTKHSWILITDPDEYVDPTLSSQICDLFAHLAKSLNIGSVTVPWRFYFKNKPLLGTPWGGANRRVLLANRDRFGFTPTVHGGRKLAEGFISLDIPPNGDNCVHHFWMESWTQLLEKHRRYLRLEGKARFEAGSRVSLVTILISPAKEFVVSFAKCQGYRDGFTGLLLSLFWAWYQTSARVENYKYQRKIGTWPETR